MRTSAVARLVVACGSIALGLAMIGTTGSAGRSERLTGHRFTASGLELSSDAAGAALFQVEGLAPGSTSANCIAVTVLGDEPSDVRLHAGVTGALDTALALTIEHGSGGTFNDCAGFTGAPIFTGTLAQFTSAHFDHASGLGATIPPHEPASYRFTVSLSDDNGAQGAEATAQFTWEAQTRSLPTTSAPTTTPPTTMRTAPTPDPPPPAAIAEPPADGGQAALPGPAGQTSDPAVPDSGSDDVLEADADAPVRWLDPDAPDDTGPERPGDDRGDAPSGVLENVVDAVSAAVARAVDVAIEVTVAVGKRSAFPGALLVTMGMFLIVQHFLDRRDPKLALAPVHRDPDLGFGDEDPEETL